MGACSLIKITRTKAKAYLVQKLFNADDTELEGALEHLRDELYHAVIVEDHEENDDELI